MGTLGAALSGGSSRLRSRLSGRLLAVGFLGGGNGGLEGLGTLGEGSFDSLVPGGGFTGNSTGHYYYFVYSFFIIKFSRHLKMTKFLRL
jgi:hypothetical protein